MEKLFIVFSLLLIHFTGFSAVIIVENTNDAGNGSLRQAIIDANNFDSITFNPSLIATGNNTIVLTSGEINYWKSLTIIGLMTSTDTLFVSGNNAFRVFNITGGTTKMDKMAIVNGRSNTSGGGIYASGLILVNSLVRGNKAITNSPTTTTLNGGGIFAYNLTLVNTTVIGNTASSQHTYVSGGGVYSDYLTISYSKIIKNKTIATSTNNSAIGGGIRAYYLTIKNSTVEGNLAESPQSTGGGIYVSSALLIENSTINKNIVSAIGNSHAYGGGIYAYAVNGGSLFQINNSTISGNIAKSNTSSAYGGGIYGRSNSVSSTAFSTIKLKNCTLIGDTVVCHSSFPTSIAAGGAIYADNISIVLDHTIVKGNIAKSSTVSAFGGGVYITTNNSSSSSKCELTMLDSEVSGNSVSSPSTAYGGGIYALGNSISYTSLSSTLNLKIDNSKVSNNLASSSGSTAYGGGIFATATANQSAYDSRLQTTINNSTISNNSVTSITSTTCGGGIYAISKSDAAKSFLTINHSTINGNSATSINSSAVGGGIYTSAGVTYSDFTMAMNYSTLYGNTTQSNSSFPTATAAGAGLYAGGTAASILNLKNSTLSGNTCTAVSNAVGSGILISLSNTSTSTCLFTIGSTIVAGNVGGDNIVGTISVNNGYNIFQGSPIGAVGTDQTNITSTLLNLGSLQNNGGSTLTAAPNLGSVAINMGNPADVTNAQNGAVIGVRDVGAAENGIVVCPTSVDTLTVHLCYGESYSFDGNTLTNPGIYRDTLVSVSGCDSVVVLDLEVDYLVTGVDQQSACNMFTWSNGLTYNTSNAIATDTLISANGCDSVVTLYLIIYQPETTTDSQTACGSYTWSDGITYTANNTTATQTLVNSNGCDSTVTLNLTITNSVTGTDMQTACGSYTWIDGNTYTTSNNTATFTLPNGPGCDSIVTLDLTITNTVSGTDVQTACGSYTWIDGNTYTANNNTATYVIPNGVGCDSIVTLNLTINHVNVSTAINGLTISSNASGSTYQWIDCNTNSLIQGATTQSYTALTNGIYAVIVASNNCSDTSNCVIINDVSLKENYFGTQIVAYPNPTSGIFNIDFEDVEEVHISVINSLGETIYALNNPNKHHIEIETEGYSRGVYFVKIQNEKEQMVIKLVKQ